MAAYWAADPTPIISRKPEETTAGGNGLPAGN
jgi:hypothetical protein